MDFLLDSELWMAGHQVDLVSLHRPALVLTDFTINGVFPMGITMFLELALCSESLSTDVAGHWPLVAVLESNMLIEKSAQSILLITHFTLKGTYGTVFQSPKIQTQTMQFL